MTLIEINKGVFVMADAVDYAMWKSQKAWELAMRIIPDKVQQTGAWTEASYLQKTQEELQKAYDIMTTVFAHNLILTSKKDHRNYTFIKALQERIGELEC